MGVGFSVYVCMVRDVNADTEERHTQLFIFPSH